MNGPVWNNKGLFHIGIRDFAMSTMLYKWYVIRFTEENPCLKIKKAKLIFPFSTFGWSLCGVFVVYVLKVFHIEVATATEIEELIFFKRYSINRTHLVYL